MSDKVNSFMTLKFWHPANRANREKKFEAEERERTRRAEERRAKVELERNLQRMAEQGSSAMRDVDDPLAFMYAVPTGTAGEDGKEEGGDRGVDKVEEGGGEEVEAFLRAFRGEGAAESTELSREAREKGRADAVRLKEDPMSRSNIKASVPSDPTPEEGSFDRAKRLTDQGHGAHMIAAAGAAARDGKQSSTFSQVLRAAASAPLEDAKRAQETVGKFLTESDQALRARALRKARSSKLVDAARWMVLEYGDKVLDELDGPTKDHLCRLLAPKPKTDDPKKKKKKKKHKSSDHKRKRPRIDSSSDEEGVKHRRTE